MRFEIANKSWTEIAKQAKKEMKTFVRQDQEVVFECASNGLKKSNKNGQVINKRFDSVGLANAVYKKRRIWSLLSEGRETSKLSTINKRQKETYIS